MIRPATAEDVPRLVELGEMLHRMSTVPRLVLRSRESGRCAFSLIWGLASSSSQNVTGSSCGGWPGAYRTLVLRDKLAFDYSLFIQPGARHGITAMKLIYAFASE